MTIQPRLASAVMLLRDSDEASGQGIEVFMVRRVIQSDFMPDVYVFPGGSVSADDRAAEQAEGVCTPVAPGTADPEGRTILGTGVRAAAIRELFEEAGILLAYRLEHILAIGEDDVASFAGYRQAFNERKGSLTEMAHAGQLRLATDLLGYFAHWITPEGMPKRFDTHFFITSAPAEQQAAHDRLETSEGIWISPVEALARYERGAFPLVFATIYQLRELAAFHSVSEALQSTAMQHVATRIPILMQENGATQVYLSEDAANTWKVPDQMTRPYSIILAPNPSLMTGPGTNTIVLGGGASGAIVIDPAVDDAAYLDALIAEGAKRGGIRRILITHGHSDHSGGAAALRERLGVPISAFSRAGVPLADEEIADGTTFPVGVDTLRAIHTPGHRFDHLCYFLEGRRTLFAGDMIAGVGTVVIIPPEGNMQHYLDTLALLQQMDIAEMVPAHGPTISDPQAKLAEYIAHRLLREQQVIRALEELPRGVTIHQMVPYIYTDVDPKLHPVAAWSVEAHLLKLEHEGLVEKLENNGWALVMPTA